LGVCVAVAVGSRVSAVCRSARVFARLFGVDSMARDVSALDPMLTSIESMNRSMQSMTFTTATMRDEMGSMSRNIGRPMSFMNSFLPW
jgi:hypothetical protein